MNNPSTPLPEQGGFNERLDEIAAEYYHRWVKYGYYGNPEKLDQDTEFNQFKAAIRTLVLEVIVSANEKTNRLGSPEWNFVAGQNALRNEQRKKLGGQ